MKAVRGKKAPRVHPDMVDVTQAIMDALQARGWSLFELVKASGQTTTTVYGLLHYGRAIHPDKLDAIANAVGVHVARENGKWVVV